MSTGLNSCSLYAARAQEADYPYPGLRPYSSHESNIFFGRKKHVTDLLGRLNKQRFLAVVGPSGCGKSSLIRAGLIPALEGGFMAGSRFVWSMAVMRPGNQPMRRLAESLLGSGIFGDPDSADTPSVEQLQEDLNRGPRSLVELLQVNEQAAGTNLLVLVDQFEEIFRLERSTDARGSEESREFINLLLESVQAPDVAVYIVITMRTDYLGKCPVFHGLPEALNASQYLTPRLSRDELRSAIEAPARMFGCEIEPELVNRILNAMGTDPDQLPLMQHMLMRMWRKANAPAASRGPFDSTSTIYDFPIDARERLPLGMKNYRNVGGLEGALEQHAETVFLERLTGDRQRWIAEQLFRRLTELTDDGHEVRRTPVPTLGELASALGVGLAELEPVVNTFRAEGRSFLMPPMSERLEAATPIDISHESLIRQWNRLKTWTRDEAKSAQIKVRIGRAARDWESAGCGYAEAVLSPARLAEALEWSKKHPHDVSPIVMEFLRVCEGKRISAARDGLRQKSVVAFSALAVVCLVAIGTLWWWLTAVRNEQLAQGQAIQFSLKEDYAQAALYWNRSYEQGPRSHRRLNRVRLATAIAQSASLEMLMYHPGLNHADMHPTGPYVVTAGNFASNEGVSEEASAEPPKTYPLGSVIVWRTDINKQLPDLPVDLPVRTAYWVENGQAIVAAAGDEDRKSGRLVVWHTKSDRVEDGFQPAQEKPVDGAVILLEPYPARATRQRSLVAALIAKEKHGEKEGDVYLWDWCDPNKYPVRPGGATVKASQVIFSPDGRYLAAVGGGGMFIWDVSEGKQVKIVGELSPQQQQHLRSAQRVAFSPDGTRLLTGGRDGVTVLWSLPDGKPAKENGQPADADNLRLAMLGWRAHTEAVESLAFGPSDRGEAMKFASASQDNTATIWVENRVTRTASPGDEDSNRFQYGTTLRHDNWVYRVEFSPDGKYVMTVSRDHTARVWDADSGRLAFPIMRHGYSVQYARFGPRSDQLLTVSYDCARVWNLSTGNPSPMPLNDGIKVAQVSISADSCFLVTAGEQGNGAKDMVRLWNLEKGTSDAQSSFSLDGRATYACIGEVNHEPRWILASSVRDPLDRSRPDYRAIVFDVRRNLATGLSTSTPGPVQCAAFSPDGNILATAHGAEEATGRWTIQLWRTDTVTSIHKFEGLPGPINQMVFGEDRHSPGTQYLAAVWAEIGDPAQKWGLWQIVGHKAQRKQPQGITDSEDKKTLVRESQMSYATFDPSCSLIATAGTDDCVRLWSVATGKQQGGRLKHTADVTHATFDRSGSRLATSGMDGATRVWDVNKIRGQEDPQPEHMHPFEGRVNRAAFSSDSKFLVAAIHDGTVQVFDTDDGEMIALFRPGGDVLAAAFDSQSPRVFALTAGGFLVSRSFRSAPVDLPPLAIGNGVDTVPRSVTRHAWKVLSGDQRTFRERARLLAGGDLGRDTLEPLKADAIADRWKQGGETLRQFFHQNETTPAQTTSSESKQLTAADR